MFRCGKGGVGCGFSHARTCPWHAFDRARPLWNVKPACVVSGKCERLKENQFEVPLSQLEGLEETVSTAHSLALCRMNNLISNRHKSFWPIEPIPLALLPFCNRVQMRQHTWEFQWHGALAQNKSQLICRRQFRKTILGYRTSHAHKNMPR